MDDAIARIDARFEHLERRMDRLEQRMDGLAAEVAQLRGQMVNGFIALMVAHAGTITAVLVAS